MSKSIEGFENILASLDELDNRNEGTITLLESMISKDPSRVQKAILAFENNNDDDVKGILAGLIIKYSNDRSYKEYLINHHDWDESDFD